ncbi:MAG: efflux transporter, rnd family, mfp subunit precursor [uncultured bacterium]|nr:MAG: efflux transporter, rnd family, mfp subunit precursor [uncultured bacterium]
MTRTKGSLIASVAMALLALGWGLTSKSNEKQTSKPTAGFILAKESRNEEKIEISGFANGANRAEIAPMASGKIIRLLKYEGEKVSKGQALAIIEATQADAQLEAASATVKSLEKTVSESEQYYDQLVDEAKESGANDESVQSAKRARDLQIQATKSQLAAANGALKVAKAGKGNLTLTAPFAGTIIAINEREGGFANFSMPLISLSTENNLEIETYVSAQLSKNILVGTVATFQAPDEKTISGTVTAVAPGADNSNFKTLIRIRLNDEQEAVHLGDFLRGEILIPRQGSAISIPRKALISRGGDQVVFVLDENNRAKQQPVKAVAENGDLVDITEGLSIDQKVVVEGQQYLVNNSITSPYETK